MWREQQIDELESSQGGGESSNLNSKIAFEQIDDCSGGRVGCSKCEACVCNTNNRDDFEAGINK